MAKAKKRKSKRRKRSSKKNPDTCFVIMPFGDWFDEYYRDVFCPAIESAGLTPRRADDLYRPSTIVTDIWTYTQEAKIVLADLSGKNPNVFYELGLAHALAKPAILVTESIQDVPFDLRALRVLEYDKGNPFWGTELRAKIEKSIEEVLSAPIQAVLPAFLSVKDDSRSKGVTQKERQLKELQKNYELLQQEIMRSARSALSSDHEIDRAINYYIKKGMSPSRIYRRLIESGYSRRLANERLSRALKDGDY